VSSNPGRSSILSSSAGSNALADFFTATPVPTQTPTPEPTETPLPPTATPEPAPEIEEEPEVETQVEDTPEPEPTETPVPPTDTPEPPPATPVPPTETPTPVPTATNTPAPSPTPTRTPRPSSTATPSPGEFSVTRYADSLEGNSLGCTQYGTYDPDNPLIVAVGPARHFEWPCGTPLRICGPAGCITAVRADSCPGCGPNHIDMSRAGVMAVCGNATGCSVTVQRQ